MQKMNKIIKFIILAVIVFIAIILLISICNYEKQDSSYSAKLIKIIDKDEEYQLSEKELESYEREIKEELNRNLKQSKNVFKIKQDYYAIGAIKYLQDESVKSMEYLNNALEYGSIDNTNKNTVELDIKIYSALSSNHIRREEIKESEVYFEEAKAVALRNDRKDLLCELYYGKAKSLASAGYNINESIDLMRKALEYTDLENHRIRNYLYLATLYNLVGKSDLALEYTIDALEIAMKLNNNMLINKCIISIGEIYYTQKNYSKTIYTYESYFIDHKLETDENKLIVYGYLTDCYAKEGDYIKYKVYKDKYIELANKIGDSKDLVWIYIVCAKSEVDFLNIDKAKEYLKGAQYLYNQDKENMYSNTDVMLDFINTKIDYFETKNYDKALSIYENVFKKINGRGIKSDISSEVVYEVLGASLENDDFKTFKKYAGMLEDYKKKEASQTYTDSIYAGINNTIKEKRLIKEKFKTLILLILSILSIYELVNSKRKNKKINKLNQKLKELNTLDPLTHLYNRGYLLDQYKEIQKRQEEITFMMIDIDYFKLYNDNYGHIKGDEALIEVANIIKDVFKDDMVFRYGGEEFSVISIQKSKDIIQKIEKLRVRLDKENIVHQYSKVSDRITLSIGVASGKVCSEEDLIAITKQADNNLYKSKEEGRDRYTYIFGPDR